MAQKSLGTRRNTLDIECHMTFGLPGIVWIALGLQSDVILIMQCMQTCSVVSCLLLPSSSFFVCFFVSTFLVLISFNLHFESAAVCCCTWSHSALLRDLYLITHNTHKRHTTISLRGFEYAIPASERPQFHALGRAARSLSLCTTNYKFNIYV